MGWFDIVILVVIFAFAIVGLRYGLIRALFNVIGVIIGSFIAGQFSDDVGEILSGSVSNDTLVTVITYGMIIIIAIILSNLIAKMTKPILTVATLGLSSLIDRIGGFVVGFAIGILISLVVVVGLARLTYDFDPEKILKVNTIVGSQSNNLIPHSSGLSHVGEGKAFLEESLTGSVFVPVFINVFKAMPSDTFGHVTGDFRLAIDVLDSKF